MKHFALFLSLVLLAGNLAAQDTAPSFVLSVNSDLMELHVSVVDEKDRTVSGLLKDNFKIMENGREQPISVFKHEDVPVSLGLVIDNSRSIEPRKTRLDAAVLSFVRQSNAEDETFVVHFDFDARMDRDFTSKLSEIETTLAASKPFGQTAIYDALMLSLEHMQGARNQKKALLLVTDGLDNASKATFDEVIETVKHSRVMVIVVGLLSASEGAKAEETLTKIADASGGRAFFPDDVEQARAMMERTAHDLRTQYTIGYVPTDPAHDGSWRSVRVDITPPPGTKEKLDADYRHGYYRPDQ
ncbi:MAG TPA: VWA domain-containing protein [Terriglobia bacterium]|nr:VWA domain-containing protein [Terriglobia bacterium]